MSNKINLEFLKQSSENEMISEFLKAELCSVRFGNKLANLLEKLKLQNSIIFKPDLLDIEENTIRRQIISKYRGYGENKDLFENFPHVEVWEWICLSNKDLEQVKYINYDYWVELSSGSRLAKKAAQNINNNIEIFNQKNNNFINASKKLLSGVDFPPMILISNIQRESLVVLEGHLRLTAYMLEPSAIPEKVKVIVGYASSNDLKKWKLF